MEVCNFLRVYVSCMLAGSQYPCRRFLHMYVRKGNVEYRRRVAQRNDAKPYQILDVQRRDVIAK